VTLRQRLSRLADEIALHEYASWGLTSSDELVETTDQRHAYVGIRLAAGPASMQFAGSNAQDHLKTVLQRRDPRAAELVRMIRELAGVRSRR
jgi:hypothetical protein